MSRTVLITGASGLIGSLLTSELKSYGYTIRTLTTSGKEDEHTFYWNPEKGEINPKVFKDIHTIVHLAGSTIAQRWTPKARKSILDSRIKGAKLLMQPAIDSGLKKFITASAIGIYPQNADGIYDDYSEQRDKSFPAEVVQQWEAAADEYQKHGVAITKIRTGVVLHPSGGALKKMLLPVKLGIGSPIGSGRQMVSWIHIRDVVNIYIQAIVKAEMVGVYNATAPAPVSNKMLMKTIAKVLNKPFVFPNVPGFVLRLFFGEMASITLEGSSVIPKKLLNEGFVFQYPEIEDALRDLLH
ncbi:MAG: TIGR01777 family oxidoreductase [Thermaurantimonas sp.]